MNSTGYIGLVDTDRTELRERIAVAWGRFDRQARAAAPDARVPRSEWTVQQTVAHVLTIAHRYVAVARGGDYRHAGHPREVDVINQEELGAVMAPVSDLPISCWPSHRKWMPTSTRSPIAQGRFPSTTRKPTR